VPPDFCAVATFAPMLRIATAAAAKVRAFCLMTSLSRDFLRADHTSQAVWSKEQVAQGQPAPIGDSSLCEMMGPVVQHVTTLAGAFEVGEPVATEPKVASVFEGTEIKAQQ
jgi:hypothetical protein